MASEAATNKATTSNVPVFILWYLKLNNANSVWLRGYCFIGQFEGKRMRGKLVFKRIAVNENSKEQHFFGSCKSQAAKIFKKTGLKTRKRGRYSELCCGRYNYICKNDGMYSLTDLGKFMLTQPLSITQE
jgi:hypothetical protein